jgi:ribosomal-protein-alanine N-acetyltransferase
MTPAQLAALHARSFTTPRPWSEADFASFLQDPLAFLLTEGDAAFLLGRAVAGEAELLTLAVAPESRRLGLARKLVTRFLYQARLRAAETAFLEVAADNAAAQALYVASGFAESGRRRNYYQTPQGDRIDAVLMQRSVG